MRLKLALSNLKSHALISILIVLLMSCIYGVGLVGIECTNYLVQANISELKNQQPHSAGPMRTCSTGDARAGTVWGGQSQNRRSRAAGYLQRDR